MIDDALDIDEARNMQLRNTEAHAIPKKPKPFCNCESDCLEIGYKSGL